MKSGEEAETERILSLPPSPSARRQWIRIRISHLRRVISSAPWGNWKVLIPRVPPRGGGRIRNKGGKEQSRGNEKRQRKRGRGAAAVVPEEEGSFRMYVYEVEVGYFVRSSSRWNAIGTRIPASETPAVPPNRTSSGQSASRGINFESCANRTKFAKQLVNARNCHFIFSVRRVVVPPPRGRSLPVLGSKFRGNLAARYLYYLRELPPDLKPIKRVTVA